MKNAKSIILIDLNTVISLHDHEPNAVDPFELYKPVVIMGDDLARIFISLGLELSAQFVMTPKGERARDLANMDFKVGYELQSYEIPNDYKITKLLYSVIAPQHLEVKALASPDNPEVDEPIEIDFTYCGRFIVER